GLREPTDPKLTDTLKVVDATLRVETPNGAVYHRYPDDGYGEHPDGSPFDGDGIGRGWPLLAGERGHGELMLGKNPTPYLNTMARTTGPGGLIPEPIWDSDPIPERFLYPGKPSGSAMRLGWAHAEYLKLLAAAATGKPVELLDVVKTRYAGKRPHAATWFWRDDVPFAELDRARTLVIEATTPFNLEYSLDDGATWAGRDSTTLGLSMHGVRFAASELSQCTNLHLRRQDGIEHTITIGQQATASSPAV